MNKNQTDQPKAKILIVDDMPANRDLLRRMLEPEGYEVYLVPSGEIALQVAREVKPDLILLDIVMPEGMNGFETCRQLKQDESTKDIPVVFITVKDEMESVVQGFQVGGMDYIIRPFREEEVLIRVETHLKNSLLTQQLLQKNRELQQEIKRREQAEEAQRRAEDDLMKADEYLSLISQQEAERWGIKAFIGQSKTIRKIVEDVRLLQSAETTGVLITGESGTGKELIARAIHFGSSRAKGRFIAVNCSAIPSGLAESTFFGHAKGAFTGADKVHKGYFELADGGTLFFDEIDDMPLELQTKLLRVIEDGSFTPVGSDNEKHVDVRILAATKTDLSKKVAEGKFQDALYFRLARFFVHVPPLRQRPEDIPLLIDHFLSLFAADMGIEKSTLSSEALKALENYQFPGNVRELKNIIEHALILSRSGKILLEHLCFTDIDKPHTKVERSENSNIEGKKTQMQAEYSLKAEQLMLERTQTDDEENIMAYLREHGSINNQQCRELLSVDKPRASYLLKKLHQYGLLALEGDRRWSRYRLKNP